MQNHISFLLKQYDEKEEGCNIEVCEDKPEIDLIAEEVGHLNQFRFLEKGIETTCVVLTNSFNFLQMNRDIKILRTSSMTNVRD